MEYLLAHDVGTTGCKAALVTPGGQIVATSYQSYSIEYPQPLRAEQDPEAWWRATVDTTREVLEKVCARPGEILALAFSSQLVNTIPLDGQGRPLRPCINWLDGRAWEEAQWVMRKLGGPAVFARLIGTPLTGKDLLPKYIWLKKHEPQVYARAAALVDTGGYMIYRTTGRLACDWSVASVTGLFNLKTKTWDMSIMRVFGLHPEKFPELVRSTDLVGCLTAEAAAELGLLEGTPVFGGAGDAMTSAVGCGAVGEADGHLSLGTSGYVGITTARRVVGKRGIVSIQSADPDKLLLIAETETSGACLKWAAKELYCAAPDAETLSRMDIDVAETEPGAGGLIFTPWMYGERCPVADESLRAAFLNLGTNHTRSQMTRAIYEGVAYNFRWILESITSLYRFLADPLRVTGGGARGLPWLRILSDVTGRKLEAVASPQQTTAMGAALVSAIGLGIYPSFEAVKDLIPVEHELSPETDPKPVYDRVYPAYRQVYRALRNIYHTLNRPEL